MTNIEVPDWVVELSLDALDSACINDAGSRVSWHGYTRDDRLEITRAAITAALGAWVVPAGFMDKKAEFLLPRPGRCVLSSQTVLVRDAYEVRNLPLFTLRQEKPE
jgi:hypothetical protein